jgi:hypothetical protein
MSIALNTILCVTVVMIVFGVVGYLIDRSAARHERERSDTE